MAALTGQTWVTTMPGEVKSGQMELTEFVTDTPQMLRAVAVEVLALVQFVGAR